MTAALSKASKPKPTKQKTLVKGSLYQFTQDVSVGFKDIFHPVGGVFIREGEYLLYLGEVHYINEDVIWRKVFHFSSRQNIWTHAKLRYFKVAKQ